MAIRISRGRYPNNGDGAVRLFCLPYAGAGAAVFREWRDHLPNRFEICLPCLPGRDGRIDEPPATAMAPLAASLAQEMLPLLSVPYALFGHSMGAFIAFDLAQELTELGHPPAHLFVSAQRGASLPYRWPPIFDLPDDAFLAAVMNRYDNIPRALLDDKDYRAILLRTLRGDFTLTETYRYRVTSRLECPITAFGGTEDGQITRPELEAWAAETTGKFELHRIGGGHFFLNTSREELLAAIRVHVCG